MTIGQRIVLILFLASLVAGVATGNQIYYRLSYLWALLFFGGWIWSVLSVRSVQVLRSARTLRAQVGQIFEERFEIQNGSRIPRIWLEIRDESTLPGTEGSRVLTMIEGRQGRSYLARTRLVQRGVFPLGPTVLASGDVFGLFPAERRIPASESLLVYPLMVDIHRFPNPVGLLPGGEALRRRTHQVTPNAAGIREYEHGDPLNRIHWVSTARRGRLMVKEFELDPLADVWVFVDGSRNVQASLPQQPYNFQMKDFWHGQLQISLPPSTEEYSVSIAASLVRDYLRRGRAVGLVAAGQHLNLLPPDRGGRQLGKVLESLAILRATGDLPLRALVETQAKHIARGSTVVLITPSTSPELSLVLDHLQRRGIRPVLVLINASTFGGLYGSESIAARIRAMGISVRLVSYGDNLETTLSEEASVKPGEAPDEENLKIVDA